MTELSLPQVDDVSDAWLKGTPLKNVTFKDSAKKLLNEILKEDVVERKPNRKKSDEVIETEIVESVEENIDTEE